jgi:CTP synthase
VIPHITDEIKQAIRAAADGHDIAIVEIGGTVGDIESLPFLEAIRQMRRDAGDENVLYCHVTLVPYMKAAGEMKTKPTQHSVGELRRIGIQPNILICRSDVAVDEDIKKKIALFCDVEPSCVVSAPDVDCIYELPIHLASEGVDETIAEHLNIWSRSPGLENWRHVVQRITRPKYETTIAVVGKYTGLTESYKSLNEALTHGGIPHDTAVKLRYVESTHLEDPARQLADCDGILVPGGCGERGTEGKIAAVRYAREKRVPFFGICLGLQMAVIEYARHQCGIAEASSTEFDPSCAEPVIDLMPDQRGVKSKGGTMRLGAYRCALKDGSLAASIYGSPEISERHRHRYEFNNAYRQRLEEQGLVMSGVSPELGLVEMIELPVAKHPHFVGCQFHPEFKSKPMSAHPLFTRFVTAALARRDARPKDEAKEPAAETSSVVH